MVCTRIVENAAVTSNRAPKHIHVGSRKHSSAMQGLDRTQRCRPPKRIATAGQRRATANEEETAPAPDVGLGAGPSAAIATPARENAASAATTTARRKALDAISLRVTTRWKGRISRG